MGILDARVDGTFFIIKIISELVLVVASLPILIFIKRIANQTLGATMLRRRLARRAGAGATACVP